MLNDMGDAELYNTVVDYIASLDDDMKVDNEEYERRLFVCRSCDNLVNGMCKLCGCFVEVRAIKKINHCAKSITIW